MKRKMNAILALILAVMMIVPSAVVVTAATETMGVTISGATLNATGKQFISGGTVKAKDDGTSVTEDLYLAKDGTITLNVSAPAGYKVYLTTGNENAVNFTGIEVGKDNLYTGNQITVTGDNLPGKTAWVKLVATKQGMRDQEITISFAIVETQIIGMEATVSVTEPDADRPYRSKWTLSDSDYYMTESYIDVTGLKVLYNNNVEPVTGKTSNLKMGVGATKAESITDLAATTRVQVFGGDEYLTLSYNDGKYTYERTYDLDVQNSNITGISVSNVPDDALAPDEKITAEILAREILVTANYDKAGSSVLEYSATNYKAVGNYTFEFWLDADCTEVDSSIDRNTYFSIKSENFNTAKNQGAQKSWLIDDFVTFGKEPKDVDIEWLAGSTKTYTDGLTLGDRIEDWHNVKVTVHYSDVSHKCSDVKCDVYTVPEDIAKLGMEITPFDIGSRVITVKTIKSIKGEDIAVDSQITLPSDFSITENKVVKMEIIKNPTKMAYQTGDKLDLTGMEIELTYENGAKAIRTYSSDYISVSPAHGTTLNERQAISVTYKNTDTGVTLNETISEDEMEITNPGAKLVEVLLVEGEGKKEYYIGESFDLDGYEVVFVYENSTIKTQIKNLKDVATAKTFTAYNTKGTFNQKVTVKDPLTNTTKDVTIPVSVTERPEPKVSEVIILENGKTEYFVGESFDLTGYVVLFVYENSDVTTKRANLKDVATTKTFTAYSASGGRDQKVTVKDTLTNTTKELAIPVTVTVRPILESITVETTKTEYLAGESPAVKDFEIVAKYDNGTSRVVKIAADDANAGNTTASFTENGVTYTITLTPTVLDENDTKIIVSLKEKITTPASTTTKSAEVSVTVETPACILTTYTGTLNGGKYTKQIPYENFEDALEAAKNGDEIELKKDVTMTSDYSSSKSLVIDLNGHTLTMIRGELYVYSKATASTTITFTNSATADGTLIYTIDAKDNVIVTSGKDYVIDRDSSGSGKYEVKITDTKHGTVAGPDEVTHGHDAKFTLTPDEDYQIDTVKINNKAFNPDANGVVTITNVTNDLVVTVTFKEVEWENPFRDVYRAADYYKSVEFVYENGLFNGTSSTKFEPEGEMTRAMFVTVLGRLCGVNAEAIYGTVSDFKDVSSSNKDYGKFEYAVPYIIWATEVGLVEGYEDGTFRPMAAINHNEMYVLMQRYAREIVGLNTTASTTSITASDNGEVPAWARDAVRYAVKYKFTVTSGYNLLKPEQDATRGELAQLLHKFCVNVLGVED